jgi:hypothetical protein
MTALMTKPKSKPLEPVNHSSVGSEELCSWRDNTLKAYRLISKPDAFLTHPPNNVPVPELLAIKHVLDPESRPGTGRLLDFLNRKATRLIQGRQPEASSDYFSTMDIPTEPPCEVWAKDYCSLRGKDIRFDQFRSFLAAVDAAIAEKLEQGEGKQDLIFTPPIASSLRNKYVENALHWYSVAIVNRLPENCPVRSWPSEMLFGFEEGASELPTVVLGLQPHANHPRPFYSIEEARKLTAELRMQQLRNRLKLPIELLKPEGYTEARSILTRIENTLPKRQQEPPNRVWEANGQPWSELVLSTLEAIQNPHHVIVPPTANVPLEDLLAVRKAFDVRDNDANPISEAASRLVAQFFGEVRQRNLTDLLLSVMRPLERQLARWLEEGIVRAAELAQQNATPQTSQKGTLS